MEKILLTDEMRKKYMECYPRNGEEECIIFSLAHEDGVSILDIASEYNRETSTIYRIINKVKRFFEDETNLYDMEDLSYVKPRDMLTYCDTLAGTKLVMLCLATYFTFGEQKVNKWHTKK